MTRLSIRLAAGLTAAALGALPAHAAILEVKTPPTTPGYAFFLAEEDPPTAWKTEPKIAIEAAGQPVTLEETTLDDLAIRLGGDLVHAAEPGNQYWLCYDIPASGTDPAALVWFVSAYRDDDEIMITEFIIAEARPKEIPAGCVAPKTPLAFKTGVPGLGATRAVLDAAFGIVNTGADPTVTYIPPADPDDELPVAVTVGYKFEGEATAIVVIGQVSPN